MDDNVLVVVKSEIAAIVMTPELAKEYFGR
jgi:hypothetical protein